MAAAVGAHLPLGRRCGESHRRHDGRGRRVGADLARPDGQREHQAHARDALQRGGLPRRGQDPEAARAAALGRAEPSQDRLDPQGARGRGRGRRGEATLLLPGGRG